ncbi:MAG TPA: tetratricopeptide repeat protein [Bacteroidales bacterium]|nr:tetratricopeptide repeat protein [Bacteroidales bacterium]
MQKTVILITGFLIPFILAGQNPGSFRYSDSITYIHYLNKDWKALTDRGNEALAAGHDYYYMRMRLGIAYFEKHNYAASAKHFKKALEFNQGDNVATEYLFYSSFLYGRSMQAWSILSGMLPAAKKRIEVESRIKRNSITAEYFLSDSKSGDIIANPGYYFSNSEPGSQVITRYFINNAVYASHILGKNVIYSHAFTNLIKDNFLYYYDGITVADMQVQRIIQNQYYGSLNFFTSTGWVFSPSFHYLGTGYPFINIIYSGNKSFISEYQVKNKGYATGFRITRMSGYTAVSAEGSFSELNYQKQAQSGLSVTIYPSGNSNLYIGASFSALFPIDQYSASISYVTGITGGFTIKNKVWFEFSGTNGDMKNYLEKNGLLVYNSTDFPTRKISACLLVPLANRKLTLMIGAGRSWHSSQWIPADGTLSGGPNILKYYNNIITGGITWNF